MEASSKCRDFSPTCGKQPQQQPVNDYKIEMLNPFVKEEVKRCVYFFIVPVETLYDSNQILTFPFYSITCECFSQKGDLELLTGVKYEDYEPLLDDVWEHFLEANLRCNLPSNVDYLLTLTLIWKTVLQLKTSKDRQLLVE